MPAGPSPPGRLVAASARTDGRMEAEIVGDETRARAAPSPSSATDRSRRSLPEPALVDEPRTVCRRDDDGQSGGRREHPAIAGPQVGRDDRAGESPAGRVGHGEVAIETDDRPEVRVVEGHGRTAARRDDADPAGELAAGLDGEPVAGDIPGEVGREGAAEPVVGRRRIEDLACGLAAVDAASPDAEVGTGGAIDAHLVDERPRRIDRRAADDVALVGDRPRATARDVDGLEAGCRAVIGSDEDDRSERAGRERLAREIERAGGPLAIEPDRQALTSERPIAIEDRVQPIPGRSAQVGEGRRLAVARGSDQVRRGPCAGVRHPRPDPRAERRGCDEPDGTKGDDTRTDPAQPS